MSKQGPVLSPELVEALRGLGVDPKMTQRVVIDIQSGHVPVVHIERFGDESMISVVRALAGIEISRKER